MDDIGDLRRLQNHRCGAGMAEGIDVMSVDKPGAGGAHHEYVISCPVASAGVVAATHEELRRFWRLNFQKGGVVEVGHNGIGNEQLLAIVADRLTCFQVGPFACAENQEALTAVSAALAALHRRTRSRADRGVEGRLEK
jgi:hypothetical protein